MACVFVVTCCSLICIDRSAEASRPKEAATATRSLRLDEQQACSLVKKQKPAILLLLLVFYFL